jgi:hypothetical protein
LINDNNHIELARATADKNKRRISRSMLEHKKESLNASSVLHKDEDIFYGANEDEDHNQETPEGDGTTTNFFASASENIQKNQIEINSKKRDQNIELKNSKSESNVNESNSLNVYSKNKFYDSIYNSKRHELPAKKEKLTLNVWSILKDALGKDLSKFCVPGKIFFIKTFY